MTLDPEDFETTAPMGAAAVVALVRAAFDAAPDTRAAKVAAQERAAQADIAAALAAFPDGSPDALAAVAGLGALGVAAARIAASVKWYRSAHEPAAAPRRDGGEDAIDPRPIIQLTTELKANVDATVQALAADPSLYQRDGAMVRITRPPTDDAPVIRPHTLATLRVRMSAHARFQTFKDAKGGGEWIDAIATDHVAKGVLEQAEWEPIRDLAGIVEAPFMRPDETVCATPGYDPATRFLFVPRIDFPAVPDAPTREECEEALRFAWVELCYDFPFKGMGYPDPADAATDPRGERRFNQAVLCPDAWGVIAAIMTILARPALYESVPGIIFDASTPGSGKGLQVDIAALVALGRIPTKLTWPNRGKETDAEVDKMMAGKARAGAVLTIMDEITGPFGGPAINKVLTSGGKVEFRPLGASEIMEMRWVSVVLGAGNNFTYCDNTHRRILAPRLEPTEESPEKHDGWRHTSPTLPEWALANRAAIVTAILTILRGYVVAGKPDMGIPLMGSFEKWSALIPRAIMWAGGGNVLGCCPSVNTESRNEEKDAMEAIMVSVAAMSPHDGTGITVGRYLDALYTQDRLRGEHDRAPDPPHDDAREAIETLTGTRSGCRPDAKKLGEFLKVWRKRPIGKMQFDHVGQDKTKKVARWGVVPVRK